MKMMTLMMMMRLGGGIWDPEMVYLGPRRGIMKPVERSGQKNVENIRVFVHLSEKVLKTEGFFGGGGIWPDRFATVVHFEEVDFQKLQQLYVFKPFRGAGIRADNIIGFKLTYDISV